MVGVCGCGCGVCVGWGGGAGGATSVPPLEADPGASACKNWMQSKLRRVPSVAEGISGQARPAALGGPTASLLHLQATCPTDGPCEATCTCPTTTHKCTDGLCKVLSLLPCGRIRADACSNIMAQAAPALVPAARVMCSRWCRARGVHGRHHLAHLPTTVSEPGGQQAHQPGPPLPAAPNAQKLCGATCGSGCVCPLAKPVCDGSTCKASVRHSSSAQTNCFTACRQHVQTPVLAFASGIR